jgi:hypothetical protein
VAPRRRDTHGETSSVSPPPRVVCAVVSRSNSAGDLVAFMLERLAEPAVAR